MSETSVKNPHNLVWLDMEMTGLDCETNLIIEVAVVITDGQLNILTESPSYAIFQPDEVLAKMDKWNVSTHTKSGLIQRVKQSNYTIEKVEKELLELISQFVPKGESPLCGNTVHQDRKFMVKYMKKLDAYLHYRNLDVSTLKELSRRWYPTLNQKFKKHNKHQALADIHESISELKFYKEHLFVTQLEHK